jgi:excinuclease UvrABC ATPase subunit
MAGTAELVLPLDPLPKLGRRARAVELVIDRFRWDPAEAPRLVEACEQAFRRGEGRLSLALDEGEASPRSERWECSNCGAAATRPEPARGSRSWPRSCRAAR